MKLTKQQTIEGHRKMWNWIADEIEKRRRTVCIVELKMEYCKNNHLELRKWCFCCEYNEGKEDCSQCPLDWDVTKQCCTNDKSLYSRITNWTLTWQKQADLARQIANLPERKDEEEENERKES